MSCCLPFSSNFQATFQIQANSDWTPWSLVKTGSWEKEVTLVPEEKEESGRYHMVVSLHGDSSYHDSRSRESSDHCVPPERTTAHCSAAGSQVHCCSVNTHPGVVSPKPMCQARSGWGCGLLFGHSEHCGVGARWVVKMAEAQSG